MLAAFAASKLSIAAFARRQQITAQRVIFWRDRCQQASDPARSTRELAHMRPLTIATESTASTQVASDHYESLTVSIGCVEFRVRRNSDPAAIEVLVRAMQGSASHHPC
jgi:hypothetical protein